MIKSGKLNESVGMTQDDWKEVDPNDYDEGQVEGYIEGYDEAAKALKCKAKDLVNITEDDGPAYDKIIDRIKDGDKGQKVKMSSIDGQAGLFTLTNGCTVVTTNEWGYGTVYVKKSEVKKAMNESSEPINESAKIRSMTKQLGQAYSGCWQLPSGKPGMITSSDENDIEMVLCGSEKDGLQLIMTLDDGDGYFKDYKWDTKSEATAVHHFQEIAKIIDNEFIDLSKVAKKFGLKSM